MGHNTVSDGNKRETGEPETSRWLAIQGNQVANNTTRGGGRRTLRKVRAQWQLNDAGVDDAGQLDGGGCH
jgi:hypothetical protein